LSGKEIPNDKLYVIFTAGGRKMCVQYDFYQEFREYIDLIFANVKTVSHKPDDAVAIEELPYERRGMSPDEAEVLSRPHRLDRFIESIHRKKK
jgi:hypothetical protein